MAGYVAFLRGVMPTNASMPELKACFEATGLTDVRTLLSSGNVVFSAKPSSERSLERRIAGSLKERLGVTFQPFVRTQNALHEILHSDPFKAFRLRPGAKRVVTFLPSILKTRLKLPIEADGARILCVRGTEVFSAYLPNPRGPVFMRLIEKTFGKEVTTRTWDTVRKVAVALENLP